MLYESNFADYRLRIGGLVANPIELDLTELHALTHHEQITQRFCIQGCPERGPDGGTYYDAHPIEQMSHHLTTLAYDMNNKPLSFGHGAPLRLRNEVQLGFKLVKWIKSIEFVADFHDVGGGYGGYNQDHEFFGYRQTI